MAIPNDFQAAGFSIRTAYYLAKASEAAYADQLGDLGVELALGDRAATFQFEEFHGFVADLGGDLLLAFRGTANVANWLTDSHIIQVEDPAYPGKVHRGFAGALEGMWPTVKGLMPPPGPGRAVWVTGHSLGGALASLAAVRLLREGYRVAGTYTYGSPRVGDLAFYEGYEPVNYRFVNNNDVVPHVPLETLLLGVPGVGMLPVVYKHVGTLKYLDRHGRLGEGMSGWAAKKEFMLNALFRAGGVPGLTAVDDHHIANYVQKIAVNLPAPVAGER
jgi:hypothetical protein